MTDSATDTTAFDQDLDARGLNCPLPILQTKRELNRLNAGQVLRVRATDPHAEIDFLAFTEKTSHRMAAHWQQDGEYHFLIEKGR